MISDPSQNRWRRYAPLVVYLVVMLAILLIPLKIIAYGFLPADDALRHAAQGVSGKDWSQVLVLGSPIKVDFQFGWDLFQRLLFRWLNCDAETLVEISMVSLFVLFNTAAMLCLKRPEAWLGALFLDAVTGNFPDRFVLGRPLMVTMTALVAILLLWERRRLDPPRARDVLGIALIVGAACFIHGTWYLWVLLVAAFFLARQFRWGMALALGWGAGAVLAGVATGHPLNYLTEAALVAVRCVSRYATQDMLVGELQPHMNFNALLVLGLLWLTRQAVKISWRPWTAHPAFWLAGMGWILGCRTGRFWFDWGLPALLVLFALDLQSLLEYAAPLDAWKRAGCAGALAMAAYAAITSDTESRWTYSLHNQYLTQDNPSLRGWLPEKGGIFYSTDMQFFNQTYMKNPRADWKYVLGFEPTLMPAEDFVIFHRIIWNYGDDTFYDGWVRKMRPEDRLEMTREGGPPGIPQLEWLHAVKGYWIGRLPRAEAGTNATPKAAANGRRIEP
jgi:hypothetical protein